jgi:hypothetical protein
MSRFSAVGIATGYGLDDRGVGVPVPVGPRVLTSPYRPYRLFNPSHVMVTGGSPGREADHSLPTSAEVNKTWI